MYLSGWKGGSYELKRGLTVTPGKRLAMYCWLQRGLGPKRTIVARGTVHDQHEGVVMAGTKANGSPLVPIGGVDVEVDVVQVGRQVDGNLSVGVLDEQRRHRGSAGDVYLQDALTFEA